MTTETETLKMAQAANIKAQEALHVAEMVKKDQTAHEAICAERYAGIKRELSALPDIYEAINEVKAITNRMIGVSLIVPGLGAIAAVVMMMFKIAGK